MTRAASPLSARSGRTRAPGLSSKDRAAAFRALNGKRHKYGARRTVIDGKVFPSKAQAARYVELSTLLRAGQIRNLRLEVNFPLVVNAVAVCTYRADFVYEERQRSGWMEVVEDTKGKPTRDYILKRRLMLAVYGIDILETR